MRFLGIDPERDRWHLQALRADPPGYARDSGARRSVFGAALEQWDALLLGGSTVNVSASPILIFYALAQATQALCASRVMPQPWRPSSHGMSVSTPSAAIGETQVSPTSAPDGAFALLCRALDCRPLTGPTSLNALWASNPHAEVAATLGAGSPPVIALTTISSGELATRALLEGDLAKDLPQDPQAAAKEITRRLSDYPTVAEALEVSGASARVDRAGNPQVEIGWRDNDGTVRAVSRAAPGLGPPNSGAYLLWNSPDFAESFALAAKAAERMVCNAEDKARVLRAVPA